MGSVTSRFQQDEVLRQWNRAEKTIEVYTLGEKPVIKRSGWKTVRIFVSSTFKDFHAEREVLVKETFPDLRAWCLQRRLHLVECDLRWGVPKDTASEDTLRICLEELDRCYADNTMPFFLNMTSERCGWIPGASDVPRSLAKEYRWIFGLSVTEMEIMHGAYRKDNPNSLFAIRDQSFVETLPEDRKEDFVDGNPIAPRKTQVLKRKLMSRFPDERVFNYDCRYAGIDADTTKVELDGLREFSQKVFNFFKSRIEEQYPLDTTTKLDPYQVQLKAQEAFTQSRSEVVIGREGIIESVDRALIRYGTWPILLLGAPGVGKSSVMARIAVQYLGYSRTGEGGYFQGWYIFHHFVGVAPGSTNLEFLLKRMLREMGICNASNMPKDLEAAAQLARSVLANPNTRPTIIIVDALNQLQGEENSDILSWLPPRLSSSVKCILSTIDGTLPHHSLQSRTEPPDEIYVTSLDLVSRKKIVQEVLGKYGKRLDKQQMGNLLLKDSSKNPLWLSLACEELRVYGVFERVTDKIVSLQDSLPGLLAQVLDRCEEEYGGLLLASTVCLIESSRSGLLEVELLSLLAIEDSMAPEAVSEGGEREQLTPTQTLPAMKWAVIYRGLRPFLRLPGDSGEGRLDFYHQSLSKAVRQKYFEGVAEGDHSPGSDGSFVWHKKLADYFQNVQHIERRVEEYPHQLCKINDKDRLSACLSEWEIFDELYSPDYSAQLLTYWRHVDENYEGMHSAYTKKIELLRGHDGSQEILSRRLYQIAKVHIQSGLFGEARAFLEEAVRLEQSELGDRPECMVDLLDTYGELFDEICKTEEFVREEQVDDLRPAIKYSRESAELRKTLLAADSTHNYKLGLTLMRLSFNLNAWIECGGDDVLNVEEAKEQRREYIEQAIEIFRECGDLGKEAEANMTSALIYPRGSQEQLDLYEKSREQCLQAYGEHCKLMTRIICNIGTYYEDKRDFNKAFEYFSKWKDLATEVFGENHPQTIAAGNCLDDPDYRRIAEADPVVRDFGDRVDKHVFRDTRAFKAAGPCSIQ